MDSKEFFYRFGQCLYKIDGFYAEYARVSGVKENLLWVLYALNDGMKHSQKEICSSWDLPRTTVNTIVAELKEEGYVSLSQIHGEKRELSLALTDNGKEYAGRLLAPLYEIEEKVFDALSPESVLADLQGIHMALAQEQKGEKR